MWPAFWMLGNDIGSAGWPNSGEIDIMENVGFEPGTVHGTIHGPGYSGSGGIGAGYTLPGGAHFADAFHTFAVDWAPNSITWSVDGNVYQTRTPADLNGNRWVFDHPFYIILNLAVGGYWPGDPDGSTPFPQQLVVDYVHVTHEQHRRRRPRGQITGLRRQVRRRGRRRARANGTAGPALRLQRHRRAAVDRRVATARCARWASAWTSRPPARPTARRCSCTTATAPAPRSGRPARTVRW